MVLRVIDLGGVERDEAWLKATYAATVQRAPATETAFRLVRVEITEAPSTLMVMVKNLDGSPAVMHATAMSWSDAPDDLTLPEMAPFLSKWQDRVKIQWTHENGDTGYGLEHGSYYSPPDSGPHVAWVLHNLYRSDALAGIGMLPNTVHRGPLRLTFQLTKAAEVPVPDPGDPPDVPPDEWEELKASWDWVELAVVYAVGILSGIGIAAVIGLLR